MSSKLRPSTITLSEVQKEFVESWYWKFLTEKASRGVKTGENAQKWTTESFVPMFMEKFHPDMDDEEAEGFRKSADYTIYTFWSNMWKRDPHKEIGITDEQGRISPENLWARANAKEVAAAVKQYRKDHEDKPVVAAHRIVVCRRFKELSEDDQLEWKTRAEQGRQLKQLENSTPLEGEARAKFARNGMGKIHAILKELDQRAGVPGVVLLAMEKEGHGPNALIINTLASPSVKDFNDGANQFAEYITDHLHKRVEGGKPRPAVIPGKDGRPIIPEFDGTPTLERARRIVRVAGRAFWQFVGGQLPLPWGVIAKDMAAGNYTWIAKARMPDPLPSGDLPRFGDPAGLTLPECMSWIKVFSRHQEGAPVENCFQFEQVYASLSHQWPSGAEPTSKERIRRGNIDVHLVRHSGWVPKPLRTKAISYPEDSWEYFHFGRDGSTGELWNGLRAGSELQALPVISTAEAGVYKSWFEELAVEDQEISALVAKSIEKLNEMETYLPLIAKDQLWSDSDTSTRIPQLLPQSPPSAERIASFASNATFWAHISFFGPVDEALPYATVPHVELWQKKMRTGALYHAKSQTFLGGKWGVVWVVRAIILLLANAAAACGKMKPPVPAPDDYELDRMAPADVKRAVSWLTDWLNLLEKACEVLLSSYDERAQPPGTPPDEDGGLSDKSGDKDGDSDPRSLAKRISDLAAAAKSKAGPSFARMNQAGESDHGDTTSSSESDEAQPNSKGKQKASASKAAKKPAPKAKPKPTPKSKATQQPASKPGRDYLKVPDRAEVDFANRPALFGAPLQPTPLKQMLYVASEVTAMVPRFVRAATVLVSDFLEDERPESVLQYSPKIRRQVQDRLAKIDEERRPLWECILLQRAAWIKAEKQGKLGREHHHRFWDLVRQGCQVLIALDKMAPSYGHDTEFVEVFERRREVGVYTWICRCGFQQFSTSAQLSIIWANRLADAWESIPDDAPLDDLKTLVAAIRDWRNDFEDLRAYQRDFRRQVWAKEDVDVYEEKWVDCWYSYGNPMKAALTSEAEKLVKSIPVSFSAFADIKAKDNERSGLNELELGVMGPVPKNIVPSAFQPITIAGPSLIGFEGDATSAEKAPEPDPNNSATAGGAANQVGEGTTGGAAANEASSDPATAQPASPSANEQPDATGSVPTPQLVVIPNVPSYTAGSVPDEQGGGEDAASSPTDAKRRASTSSKRLATQAERNKEDETANDKSAKKPARGTNTKGRNGAPKQAEGQKGSKTRTWSQREDGPSTRSGRKDGPSESEEPQRQKRVRRPAIKG